uniref:Uncharacterized protein n=1 Tax=Maylandia zebra TaxID=106582 RepID=A0A3P9DRU7_9CICH
SSPEFTRKDYGNYCSGATRGRSESRESEIRVRLQSASPTPWTELDDVKKLLKGRSSSVSPTRSSSASITLPVPKKASVETKTISYDTTVRSGQYDTLDSTVFPTFSWSTSTLPSSSTTVINNLAPTSASVLTTSGANVNANLGGKKTFFLSSFFPLISKLCLSYIFIYAFVFTGYGVQKNVTNGGSGISTGVSTATRSQTDDAYKKDYKFVVSEKENVPAKRETDMLILAKDTGKQFTSSGIHVGGGSLSGDSIKKEKLISSYGETAQLKAETGNSYCESILKASPM